MTVVGTFETCRPTLRMSASRGTEHGQNDANDPQRVGRESRSRAIGRRVSWPSRRSRDRKPAKELFWQLPIEWVRQRLRGGVLPCTFTHTGTKAAPGIST